MISPSPALSRSNAFPMLVILSSFTKVWARTQHAPSFGVMRTAVRLHLRNQTMYLPTVSFRVLPSYVLWAYFIMKGEDGKNPNGEPVNTTIVTSQLARRAQPTRNPTSPYLHRKPPSALHEELEAEPRVHPIQRRIRHRVLCSLRIAPQNIPLSVRRVAPGTRGQRWIMSRPDALPPAEPPADESRLPPAPPTAVLGSRQTIEDNLSGIYVYYTFSMVYNSSEIMSSN